MSNIFPDILFLGALFAPFILRIAIGLVFLWMGYIHIFKKREAIQQSFQTKPFVIPFFSSFVHLFVPYFVWILGIGEMIIGVAFVVGFLTQIAALLSIIVLIKMIFFRRYLKEIAFYNPAMYFVLLAISLSLLVSGAGTFSFDIPL